MNVFAFESVSNGDVGSRARRRAAELLRAFGAVLLLLAVACAAFAQETDEDEEETNQTDAIRIFNLAQDAHEKGKLPDAVKLYDEALKITPEFPEAEYQKANALLSLKKTTEAERSLRRAVGLRDDWTLPIIALGALLIDKNEFAEAEKFLTAAVALDETSFPAYVALTDLRLRTKAAPAVLKELLAKLQTLSAKANPTAAVWTARAALERALGDRAAAKISLNRALSIEPKNKNALLKAAEISAAEGDYDGARRVVDLLFQIAPNAWDVKFLHARILAAGGNAAEALKILDSISEPKPEIIELRQAIAANNAANAAELERQLEKNPKNAALLGRLCGLYRQENPSKALDYCRRAAESEPDNINHAVGFGAALVQAKQYENAVGIFQKISKIAPDNFTARANLATALLQLKRYAEAKSEYQWLAEKQPELPAAYYFLAIAHDNLAEYPDAMANYQQFLKLADADRNRLEIERVNLRLPVLQKQIKEKKGKK